MLPTLPTPSRTDAHNLPVRQVAAGVIVDHCGRVLLTQRPDDRHLGGYWEFPGGKLEPSESGPAGLARELREEIAIEIDAGWCEPIISRTFDYDHLRVRLTMFLVRLRDPVEIRNVGVTAHRWVEPDDLAGYRLPPANIDLLPLIRAHLAAGAATLG